MKKLAVETVSLTTLVENPNPIRDPNVDPIEDSRVDAVAESIGNYGFWGGVAVGKVDGNFVILAGHNRVQAALATGIKDWQFSVVENPSEQEMLEIYGTENATQRGNDSTAIAGVIAGALRLASISRWREIEGRGTNKPIGEPAIFDLIKKVPGIDRAIIREQLANLKASGDYDRILKAAAEEIQTELEAERVAAERAGDKEKADAATKTKKRASKSAAKPKAITFDLKNVGRHFKTPKHVEVFRKLVTSTLLKEVLPVNKQAELAAAVVAEAKQLGVELTGKFIRETAMNRVIAFKSYVRAEDRAALEHQNEIDKARDLQHHFARNITGAQADAMELAELLKNNRDITFTEEFEGAVDNVQKLAAILAKWESRNQKRIESHVSQIEARQG